MSNTNQRQQPSRVTIFGAGYLGGELAKKLHHQGTPIAVCNRSGQWRNSDSTSDKITIEAVDLVKCSVEELSAFALEKSVFVLCFSATGPTVQDRETIYVQGTRKVLLAAKKCGASRVILTSSTSALPTADTTFTEFCDEWPETDRGKVQRRAERLLMRHGVQEQIPWFILRLAGLYGPGRELHRIYQARPNTRRVIDKTRATNLIHRDDALRAIEQCLIVDPKYSGLFHVCDDDHRSRQEIEAQLPNNEDKVNVVGTKPVKRSKQTQGKVVDNKKMKSVLDVRLRHSQHVIS